MKIAKAKSMAVKAAMVGLLAGAFALAAPARADAQQFAVGVQLGYPQYSYYAPNVYSYNGPPPRYAYDGPDDNGRLRFEQERRQREWVREHEFARDRDHQEWDHHDHDDHRGRW